MARLPRIKHSGAAICYHVVTRVRGRDFLLDAETRNHFLRLLTRLKKLFYVRYAAYAVLDNHYHILMGFDDPEDVDPEDAMERWNRYHAGSLYVRNAALPAMRRRTVSELTDVSQFMKRFNHHLSMRFNWGHGGGGALWQSRFHSTLVERGTALLMCAAYIELNAFRASLVRKPEDYAWCSLNHLIHGKGELVSTAFLAEALGVDPRRRPDLVRTYRAYVYLAGTGDVSARVEQDLAKRGLRIDPGILAARVNEMAGAKAVGGLSLARAVYAKWLARGRSDRHAEQWITGFVGGLWSACSALVRGSPD